MTEEQKKAKAKRMWDKYRIKLTYKEETDTTDYAKSKYFADKLTRAKETLKGVCFPEGFFDRENTVSVVGS